MFIINNMVKKTTKKKKLTSGFPSAANIPMPEWIRNTKLCSLLLFLFSFLLYANTLTHDYAQDDAIVITDNMFTQDGLSGIPGLLKYDTFYGFFKEEGKAQLVSGGRYRPLTPIMFAIELEVFGDKPWVGHLFNLVWFGLCVVLIYWVLGLLLINHPSAGLISLLAAALFAAHPIHTEAVANIKGRDEIMALLLSLSALYAYIKSLDKGNLIYLLICSVSLFLGLMAKENAITFLVIIPLSGWFFRDKLWNNPVLSILALLVPVALFLWIRTEVLGQLFGGDAPRELMNNPFLKLENGNYVALSFSEKYATITYTLGKYIQLLVWPHPLTHDYYPRQIGILSWTHPGVIASLVIYAGAGIYALKTFLKKSIFSYSFFYFVITLSIVSNLVFPVGTNMSERFIFMPSLGFCLWLSWWFSTRIYSKDLRFTFYILSAIFLLGYSFKTIDRNMVWKDNATLFLTDVETSVNSAKLQNAAGGEHIRLSQEVEDDFEKGILLDEAIEHLERAIEIHPKYKNAFLLLGNAHYYKKNFETSIDRYQQALALDPSYRDAKENIGLAYRDAGRNAGENLGDLNSAIQYLTEALRYLPEDYEANRLMGVAMGISGNSSEAIRYFEKATELLPDNADAWYNLGTAYGAAGNTGEAQRAFDKAVQIDPDVMQKNRNR